MQRFLFSMNRLHMMMRSRVHILWFLFCIIPFLNGCAFWALSGGGPMSKEEAYRAIGQTPSQMTEDQKEVAKELYDKALKNSDFPEKKERVYADRIGKSIMCFLFTLGFYMPEDSVSVEKPGEPENSLYLHGRTVVPGLVGLWWSHWNSFYNLGTGEEIGQGIFHGLGFYWTLGGYTRRVSPEIKKKGFPIVPSSYGDRYNVKTAYHLLLGSFAVGRVNHRNYMQVLWIPIPLGAAND